MIVVHLLIGKSLLTCMPLHTTLSCCTYFECWFATFNQVYVTSYMLRKISQLTYKCTYILVSCPSIIGYTHQSAPLSIGKWILRLSIAYAWECRGAANILFFQPAASFKFFINNLVILHFHFNKYFPLWQLWNGTHEYKMSSALHVTIQLSSLFHLMWCFGKSFLYMAIRYVVFNVSSVLSSSI